MKKRILIAILVASALVITGGTVLGIGIANTDFSAQLIKKEYDLAPWSDMEIEVDTADFDLVASKENTYKVIVEEREKEYYTVNVENNKLIIESIDTRKWYENIFELNFQRMKVTILAPAGTFGDAQFTASTGSIHIPSDFSFQTLGIRCSTGYINIDIKAKESVTIEASTGNIDAKVASEDLMVYATTGKITLRDSVLTRNIEARASTGRVTLNDCDARFLNLETTTGSINATLLSPKEFDIITSTGKVNVPPSVEGSGICRAKTSTGNINISIKGS